MSMILGIYEPHPLLTTAPGLKDAFDEPPSEQSRLFAGPPWLVQWLTHCEREWRELKEREQKET